MLKALPLNSLESRKRTFSPPMETWTTWRKVLLLKPGDGGRLLVSTNCSEVAQVPTQVLVTAIPLLDELELDELDELELEELELEELELEELELEELEEELELEDEDVDELLELELEELVLPSPVQAVNVSAAQKAKLNLSMLFMVSPNYCYGRVKNLS
jgi:hypothetical protein